MPPMSVCPIFEKPPASFASLIGVSLVTIVISAWISEPVASVPMNESIFITTTTVALIRPTTSADQQPERQRRHQRHAAR